MVSKREKQLPGTHIKYSKEKVQLQAWVFASECVYVCSLQVCLRRMVFSSFALELVWVV